MQEEEPPPPPAEAEDVEAKKEPEVENNLYRQHYPILLKLRDTFVWGTLTATNLQTG